ncbi:hypothetical protein K9N68_02980 [Kovacikia minuta CCNUW1]|uniref:DUF6887 family protein n=1 Tax=Kovacikia minuta TaxID=2931930 RepID=UPI001CCF85DD|nr:hypothetical protein [Kovacikia minuta]UBF26965.1 hypothetical protein K9N68_02980 [Kovacikia minuta CCNUW1]
MVKLNPEPISDEDAAKLKAEFAAEDQAMAEAALADYLPMLQREDQAMKPNFEQMTDAELKACAIAHRDEIEP